MYQDEEKVCLPLMIEFCQKELDKEKVRKVLVAPSRSSGGKKKWEVEVLLPKKKQKKMEMAEAEISGGGYRTKMLGVMGQVAESSSHQVIVAELQNVLLNHLTAVM